MKKVLLLILFACSNHVFCQTDSTINKSNSSCITEIDFIVFGGPGTAFGADWTSGFETFPAFTLGLELPFTKANYFSLEIMSHYWISKIPDNYNGDYFINDRYIKISDDYLSQFGLSTGLRFLLFSDRTDLSNKKDNFKIYGHLSYIWLSSKSEYHAVDFGVGFKYIYNDKLAFLLESRFMVPYINIGGSSYTNVPSMIILNACYKFNIKL